MWAVGVAGISLFALGSAAVTHSGSLHPTLVPALDAELPESEFIYTARIRGSQSVFRGNDLFRVKEVTFPAGPVLLSQHWDDDGKGIVVFSTAGPLEKEQSLAVVFLLQPRWTKLIEASLKVLILFLVIQLLLGRHQWPNLLKRRWFSALIVGATIGSVFCFTTVIVGWSGWVYGDTHQFLTTTIQGEYACMPVVPETGRFFPFAFLDLNLLIPFGDSPQAYHVERALFFLLTVALLFLCARKQAGKTVAAIVVLVFLTAPRLISIYGEPIFAEAVISFLLALFLFLYLKARHDQGIGCVLGCGLIASYACYCKEPVFLFFTVFALIQIGFGRSQLNTKQKYLNAYLLVNSIVFLAFYVWFCGNSGVNYATSRSDYLNATSLSTFFDYAQTHLMVYLVVGVAAFRLFSLLVGTASKLIEFDAMLLGGIAYFAAFVLLKMPLPYLIIPAYIPWLIAISGFLGYQCLDTSAQIEMIEPKRSLSVTDPIQASRLSTVILLGALLVFVMFRFDHSVNEIKQHHREREVTKRASRFFATLADQGVRMFVLYPEAAGFQLELAKFRREVLNLFHSNFHGEEIDKTYPFQSLVVPELNGLKGSCLVIVDPVYSPIVANRQFMLNHGFRLMPDAPAFRREAIYISGHAFEPD